MTRSTDFGRTPLSDIFRGELRSRLQREGDHSTDVMQPFFTLQLNIEVSVVPKIIIQNQFILFNGPILKINCSYRKQIQ